MSAVLLGLSLRSLDTDALKVSIRSADRWSLALAVCAVACVYLIQAARWRLVSLASPSVSFHRFVEWAIGAIAVNNVVPGRPGDVLRIEWLARGARLPRIRALASVSVDRGLDVVALGLLLALTYPAVHHAAWIKRVGIAGGILTILVALAFFAASAYARKARVSPAGRLPRLVADVADEIRVRLYGRRGVGAVLLSVLAWVVWAFAAWSVASAVGITLGPFEVLFVTAILNLGVAIPSSPGFIGTYQWLGVSALGVLGVNHTDAFAFSVVMHATWFIPTTIAGGILFLRKLPPVLAVVLARRSSESNAA